MRKPERHKTIRDAMGSSPYQSLSRKEITWLTGKGINLDRYARTGRDVMVCDDTQERATLKAIASKLRPGGLLVLISSDDAKL